MGFWRKELIGFAEKLDVGCEIREESRLHSFWLELL